MKTHHLINSGDTYSEIDMDILTIIHNAGFFSCSSIALQDIIIYFNQNNKLPDVVERSKQYANYKSEPLQNLISMFFNELPNDIPYTEYADIVSIHSEPQFTDYRLITFNKVKPFVDKYFNPSEHVINLMTILIQKYNIDFNNICAVFYRGNDKFRETNIAPYSEFINKAKEIKADNPEIRFLVQPDEKEFLDAFLNEFPDAIYFEETPYIHKSDNVVFNTLQKHQRGEYACWFFASVLIISNCKYLITHSGNCSIWAVLYRGNVNNVSQWLNDKWLD